MNLVYSLGLRERLTSGTKNLLLDTCVFIDASKCSEVKTFLKEIQANGCELATIPQVEDEFTCPARTKEQFDELTGFFKWFEAVQLDCRAKSKNERALFNIALSRCKNIHPSYVDRTLLSVLYLYRHSSDEIFLATLNHKDVPKEFFDRIGFITYDDGEFHDIGIYTFNADNFSRMMKNIIERQGKDYGKK